MESLTSLSTDVLLDRIASRTPTPGGGSVAAIAGALATALARMVAEYSILPASSAETGAYFESVVMQLRRIDEMLRAMASKDAEAYAAVVQARKRLKETSTEQTRSALQRAQFEAALIPLETAALLVRALGIMDEMKATANTNLLSDLSLATMVASASASGCLRLAGLNLAALSNGDQRIRSEEEAKALRHQLSLHAARIEDFISAALESPRG